MTPLTAQVLGEKPIWPVSYGGAYVLAAVMVAGLAFTWWARIYLGRLWSSEITRKEDHRIVDTGPYGIVRHPVYASYLLGHVAIRLRNLGTVNRQRLFAGTWWCAGVSGDVSSRGDLHGTTVLAMLLAA